jgi:hypothetical protein
VSETTTATLPTTATADDIRWSSWTIEADPTVKARVKAVAALRGEKVREYLDSVLRAAVENHLKTSLRR